MTTTAAPPRFERKFLPDGLSLSQVLALIRKHPALFREVYPGRRVNNLYLDSPGLRHYRDHIHGVASRVKIRIRWYGDYHGQVGRPVLEFKSRQGSVGSKVSCALPALHFDGSFSRALIEEISAGDSLPSRARLHLRHVEPVLVNRYHRRYFLSGDGAIRLTVDSGLEFMSPRNADVLQCCIFHPGLAVIVELKYSQSHTEAAELAANGFPFRLARCSKYVLGIERLACR